jgi:hypothetical protein
MIGQEIAMLVPFIGHGAKLQYREGLSMPARA